MHQHGSIAMPFEACRWIHFGVSVALYDQFPSKKRTAPD
jgi:hypothetical protein